MSFHWPQAFWFLLLPLLLAAWDITRRRRIASAAHPRILRAEAAVGSVNLVTAASAGAARARSWRWRLWLGIALTIVALARPQWGRTEEQVFEQAREILIAVDLSRSMLAPDVPPSRLERAKLLITSLLERLEGERVGLVVFAGTAFLQSPLSSDYEILREFLPALTPDFLPQGGTDYDALIRAALEGFSKTSAADRFLIVLSDGESQHAGWEKRVDELRERNITVLSLGIGTTEGAMLPDGRGGLIKDERGAVVLSRLNASTLESLARQTQGVYRDASSWVDLAELLQQTVESGRQGEFTEVNQVRQVERFQWALGPALLLLLISYWREFPVHPRSRAVQLEPTAGSSAKTAATTLTLLAIALVFGSKTFAQQANAFAGPLSETVARLSGKPELRAEDYAELANATLTYGERMRGAQQSPEPGTVSDALAAVDAGERLNPAAADWKKLREALEALRPPESPPPPEEQPQDQPPPEQSKEQDQKGSSPKDQKSEPKSSPSEQSEQKQSPEAQDSSEGENPQESDAPQSPPSSPAEAFGEMGEPPPANDSEDSPPTETQQVGGQTEAKPSEPLDPAMTATLQKLQQLKQMDSPAKLYELMQDPNARPTEKGRDW